MNPSSQPFRADLAEAERRRRIRRLRAWAVGLGAAAVAALVLGLGGWIWLTAGLPQIGSPAELWSIGRAPGMTFVDRSGVVVAARGPKHGFLAPLAQLPPHVPRAFLAAEDRRFYSHGAVDLRGVARAAAANLGKGRIVQGGSTITQQLARDLFLGKERTLRRKLQEAALAYRLERRLTKDQILELYLNRLYFGAGAYGLEAAARTYFGKPARQLSVSEAALLAALPKAPSRLAPDEDLDAALARSRLVLGTMREAGWVSEAEARQALAERPQIAPAASDERDFGYVLDMAAAEALRRVGDKAPDLVVRLSIDAALQRQAQALLAEALSTAGPAARADQGAVVALAPDGGVRALAGGRDYRRSPFNRAVQAKRQPGSAFKPIVYAAALEAGVSPADTREDRPVRFGDWAPQNYGGGYRGTVTVEEALAQSINTVAARLGAEVGRRKLGEISGRFGLDDIPETPSLPVALGAYEVSLLELTSAYQVFQNAGRRTEPHLVEGVTTARGDVLYARRFVDPPSVYDAARAGTMVRMLMGVIDHGTGRQAQIGRPAAGKTGTSQNWRDAWFVGFTPDFAAGVWVGNDDGRPMARIAGGALPAQIWARVMTEAHRGLPVRPFDWLGQAQPQAPLPVAPDAFYETSASPPEQPAADEPPPDPNSRNQP